jgi:hypothetical protein
VRIPLLAAATALAAVVLAGPGVRGAAARGTVAKVEATTRPATVAYVLSRPARVEARLDSESQRLLRRLPTPRGTQAAGRHLLILPRTVRDGRYRVEIRALSPSGAETGRATSRPFTVDRAAPVIGRLHKDRSEFDADRGEHLVLRVPVQDASDRITVRLSVTKGGKVLRRYTPAYVRTRGRMVPVNFYVDGFDGTSKRLPDGDYTIRVQAIDPSGHTSQRTTTFRLFARPQAQPPGEDHGGLPIPPPAL